VVDHHVDRPGVEARRRVKLTGTNRPIGLIVTSEKPMRGDEIAVRLGLYSAQHDVFSHFIRLVDLVALSEGPHPIPFRTRPLSPPEPMVLRLKTRESRTPPGLPDG
jgi:hypothetical protein